VVGFAGLTAVAFSRDDPAAPGKAAGGFLLVVLFAALGTLLALRQPANPIGWLLSAGGLVWLSNDAAELLGKYALEDAAGVTPALALTAVFNEWIWPLGVLFSAGLPLLLFPNGRPASRRWRWVAWSMCAGCAATVLSGLFSPAPVPNPADPTSPLENPWGLDGLRLVTEIGVNVGGGLLILPMAAAVVGILLRLRSVSGVERQQLRWIASGAAMAISGVLVFPLAEVFGWADAFVTLVFVVGFSCLPLSFTVAILRYRLYDLDRILSRTVTYAAVTGLLVAAYAALVTAASHLTPSSSSLSVAASTLAVAALFQPLRRRVQASVDRRFNRTRYDAARTVEQFRLRLRDEVELEAVRTDLLAVVRQTVQPEGAGLWLRGSAWSADPRARTRAGADVA
jgi:hypothetical protein